MPKRHAISVLVASILCVALIAGPASAQSQTPEQPAPKDMGALEVGKPVEQSIKGGESHRYTLHLEAGDLLKSTVEQKGVDVAAVLVGPDGRHVLEVDSPNGANGPERVFIVAEAAGVYTLEVKPLDPSDKGGRYETRVEEVRVATEKDRLFVEAVNLFGKWALLIADGKTAEAIQPGEQAIALFGKVFGIEHPEVATWLLNFGNLYHQGGMYLEAEQAFVRALTIQEKAFGDEHLDLVTTLNNLGVTYRNQGEFAKAERVFVRVLGILERNLAPDHLDIGTTLTNIGVIYWDQGQYEKSKPALVRAVAILEKSLGPESLELAYSLNALGSVYSKQTEYAKAIALFERTLVIREKALGPKNPEVASVLNNLGTLYRYQREYEKARVRFERSLAIVEEALGPRHPFVATALANLAELYQVEGQYTKAEPLLVRGLAICEAMLGPSHRGTADTLSQLAVLYSVTGRTLEAVEIQFRANQVREREFSHNLISGSERSKLQYLSLTDADLDRTLWLQMRLGAENRKAAQMAAQLVLQRKGRALDVMTDSIEMLRRHASPETRTLLEQLSQTRQQLAQVTLAGSRGEPGYRAAVDQLERMVDALEARISERSADLRAVLVPITLDAVQRAIPANAKLVEFVTYRPFDPKESGNAQFGPEQYIAYVFSNGENPRWVRLGEASRINASIDALRIALSDPKRRDVRRLARTLDELVMRPVRRLTGASRRLLIAPDGALNLVPFAAFVDERGRDLVQTHELTYLSSGRDLLRFAANSTPREKALVVADPAYGDVALATNGETREIMLKKAEAGAASVDFGAVRFAPLANTEAEARTLGTLLPGSSVLTGEAATEAALKGAKAPRILHVATHGYFLPDLGVGGEQKIENPLLRSGLALAGANGRKSGEDDGVLTALEVAGLDLWGTKLVVLSACETGVGEVKNGDGVYGLRRALVLAGSESQVMSLWKVSDRATRDLMVAYYRGLLAGQGRTAALRQVQLRMLRSPATRHPFYWASFIQSGAWGALR